MAEKEQSEKKKAQDKINLNPPWPKGTTGNPHGSHKKKRSSPLFRNRIEQLIEEIGEKEILAQLDDRLTHGRKKASRIELLIIRAYKRALAGDFSWYQDILDRGGGKAVARHEIEGDVSGTIAIVRAAGKGELEEEEDDSDGSD